MTASYESVDYVLTFGNSFENLYNVGYNNQI